jgi:hypothetical protein
MPEKIDLPDGGWAEFRTELTGGDQKWFYVERDKLMRNNGTGKPARVEPDPGNPAVMLQVPAVPAELTAEDNFTMLDMTAARLLLSWSRPEPLPWTPAMRESVDLDTIDAIDGEVNKAFLRLQGVGPKPATTTPTSSATSPDDADAPPKEPTRKPSGTASG